MAVTVDEKFESRFVTTGQSPSIELRYIVRGTNDQQEVTSAVGGESPETYDAYGSGLLFYPRNDITVQPIGHELWEGIVHYGPIPQTNASTFSFDTGGGTQHITQSGFTANKYAAQGETAPDFKGAIGVTADGVEGVDITVPVYQFVETHYLLDTAVTEAYRGTLFSLTGRVNISPFKGFAVGECLFLGAAGGKRAGGDWEIAFRFAGSPNMTGLVVGDITGIAKQGWEYLWVRYADFLDQAARAIVKRPVAAYVERVYPYGELNTLGI